MHKPVAEIHSLLTIAVLALWSPVKAEMLRLAVVAGNNQAEGAYTELRYAESDAARIAQALVELGRFRKEDIILLKNAGAGELLSAIEKAATRLEAAEGESLLLVFYSGHSDGQNLLLGKEKLGLGEIKQSMAASGAAVTLLVLDACNAGAAARLKGGRSAPPFLRLERPTGARGRVVLASSSASELSQESDQIRGSFFTHFLLSGLRGEADKTGDRLVTLGELYDYVYERTLERTSATLVGPQHPAFLYELSGEGGLVLADLNSETTGILLGGAPHGEYLVVDTSSRQVVAEVRRAEVARLVPLPPGKYLVKKRLAEHLLVGEVTLHEGERAVLTEEALVREEFEDPRAKGWGLESLELPRVEAVALGGWTALSRAPAGGVWSWPAGGVGLRLCGWPGRRMEAEGALLAGGFRHELPAASGRVPFDLIYVGGSAAWRALLAYGPFEVAAGGKLLFGVLQRRFSDLGLSKSDAAFGAGAAASGRLATALGPVRLALEVDGGVQFFAGAERVVCPFGTALASLSVGL